MGSAAFNLYICLRLPTFITKKNVLCVFVLQFFFSRTDKADLTRLDLDWPHQSPDLWPSEHVCSLRSNWRCKSPERSKKGRYWLCVDVWVVASPRYRLLQPNSPLYVVILYILWAPGFYSCLQQGLYVKCLCLLSGLESVFCRCFTPSINNVCIS